MKKTLPCLDVVVLFSLALASQLAWTRHNTDLHRCFNTNRQFWLKSNTFLHIPTKSPQRVGIKGLSTQFHVLVGKNVFVGRMRESKQDRKRVYDPRGRVNVALWITLSAGSTTQAEQRGVNPAQQGKWATLRLKGWVYGRVSEEFLCAQGFNPPQLASPIHINTDSPRSTLSYRAVLWRRSSH